MSVKMNSGVYKAARPKPIKYQLKSIKDTPGNSVRRQSKLITHSNANESKLSNEGKLSYEGNKFSCDDNNNDNEKAEANKVRIHELCHRVIKAPLIGAEIDEYVRLVKNMLVIRLENPFERIIKERIEAAVNKTVKPILKRLEALERKVSSYERNVLKLANDKSEVMKAAEVLKNDIIKGRDPLQDICLVIPDERDLAHDFEDGKISFERNKDRKQMLVRITSWSCTPEFVPNEYKYQVDLTKRRIDMLVEGDAVPAEKVRGEKGSQTRNRIIS